MNYPSDTEPAKYKIVGKVAPSSGANNFKFFDECTVGFKKDDSTEPVMPIKYKTNNNPKLIIPDSIYKLKGVNWYYRKNGGSGTSPWNLMDVTDFNIYVIYDKPVQAMKNEVWQDFLEIACQAAEGEKDPTVIKDKILDGVWNWMNKNIFYDASKSHMSNFAGIVQHATYGNLTFNYSRMMRDKLGNCQSASALFQVCCNAVGVVMRVRYFTAKHVPSRPLISRKLHVFGQILLDVVRFGTHSNDPNGHQVGTLFTGNEGPGEDLIYDATYRIPQNPNGQYDPITNQWTTAFLQIQGLPFKSAGGLSHYLGRFWPNNVAGDFEWYPKAQVKSVK